MDHIMLDTETLATTADAVILSLGAVKFDISTGEVDNAGFYASISIESNLQTHRRINEETLKWWMKQASAAQGVFFEEKQALCDTLESFTDWVGPNTDNVKVWSMGADFDLPLLAHAYAQYGMTPPWKFWNHRCARTFKNLPGAQVVPSIKTGVAHNALADALNQAVYISAIHAALFPPTAMTKPRKVK